MGGFRRQYRLPKNNTVPEQSELLKEGVVVFLDALGTKGVWARTSPATLIQNWQEMIKILDAAVKKAPEELRDEDLTGKIHFTAFSDTVVVSMYCYDPPSAIPLMVEIVTDAFLFALSKGIFFRGVIAVGRFCHTDTLIVGPAIDEAAEYYEKPDWIGISAAPSASFGLSRLETQKAGPQLSKWFVKYNIPTKESEQKNEWALAWPNKLLKTTGLETTKGSLLQTLSTHPISNYAISKYQNTLAFFDFCCRSTEKLAAPT